MLQDQKHLYVEPLVFEQTWQLPIASVSGQDFQALQKDYEITLVSEQQQFILKKRVIGRIVITNYDPDILSNHERMQLNQKANRWPPNDLSVDIRPDYPGGDYPFQGNFRLRSFHRILNFLGGGIRNEKEYHVEADPRTTLVLENPLSTINVIESDTSPTEPAISISYKERYFFIKKTDKKNWDYEAFRLLYQLFQMTVTEVPRVGAPSITIAK